MLTQNPNAKKILRKYLGDVISMRKVLQRSDKLAHSTLARVCARRFRMPISRHFVTEIYRESIGDAELNADLLDAAKMLAKEDKAGRAWCREHGYQGYTSYSSLDDLPQRATCFEQLVRVR